MVLTRGSDWGQPGTPAADTPVVHRNEDIFDFLERGVREFILESGDLARTLGSGPSSVGGAHRKFSLDLMELSLSDPRQTARPVVAASHCLVRSPWWRGGIFLGTLTVICNAQYLDGRNIAPRGHPNDGKVEIIVFSAELRIRERMKILARLRTGSHLPHPLIEFRQISTRADLHHRGIITIDGRKLGRAILETVAPCADAATAWIPVPPSGHLPQQ